MAYVEDANCTQKKLIKSKSGLRIVLVNDKNQSPFILNEPPWILDREVISCYNCRGKFTFTNRKHHCRRCGYIFCSSCCYRKIWLPRMCFMDPVRVCHSCADISEKELDFFDNRVPTLLHGATFLLSPSNSATTTCLCLCKLSRNQQNLQFDSAANIPPLPLDSVTSYHVSYIPETGGSCVDIVAGNCGVRLTTGPEKHRAAGNAWIQALESAFRLISLSSDAACLSWLDVLVNRFQSMPSMHFYKGNDFRGSFSQQTNNNARGTMTGLLHI